MRNPLPRNVPLAAQLAIVLCSLHPDPSAAQRQEERIDRGLVAIRNTGGAVFLSWRCLRTDPPAAGFHVFRRAEGQAETQLTKTPITSQSWYQDETAAELKHPVWSIRLASDQASCTVPKTPYHEIPLRTPVGYLPNDASIGDLDGDGAYEIVLHQAMGGKDNSQAGITGEPRLQAYRTDGAFLWEIQLGKNIREGAHYTPFLVYDFDGNGKSEVVCKTADGTVDGCGTTLGDAKVDHRSREPKTLGKILTGPEFLTVFDGRTGAALKSLPFEPARGRIADWGDTYGNRCDRFLAGVAFFDGKRPSILMSRGYYEKTVLTAWDWRDGNLVKRWTFDTEDGNPLHKEARGQGHHQLSIADVDADGRDEVVFGSLCLDDDGRLFWNAKLGHGDALHVSDLDPGRPGLEIFAIHEHANHGKGADFRDAASGKVIWSKPAFDVPRGCAMDIDPRHPGHECWASNFLELFDCRGKSIGRKPRTCNMGIWWDGDPLRELLSGTRITKWNWKSQIEEPLLRAEDFGCAANNGSKANPCLCVDLWGDWREEIIYRSLDGKSLRIFTSTHPTTIRRPCLMQDSIYRLGIAWQNAGYNQPAHLSGPVEQTGTQR